MKAQALGVGRKLLTNCKRDRSWAWAWGNQSDLSWLSHWLLWEHGFVNEGENLSRLCWGKMVWYGLGKHEFRHERHLWLLFFSFKIYYYGLSTREVTPLSENSRRRRKVKFWRTNFKRFRRLRREDGIMNTKSSNDDLFSNLSNSSETEKPVEEAFCRRLDGQFCFN